MTLQELREVAAKKGSVNVHLATAYNLRWHDPDWLATWERWSRARDGWRRTWPYVGFKFMPGSIYNPDPSLIPDPTQAAAALEYVEARKVYLATTALYSDVGEEV